jgi:ubiquinone/menaquinone biosynthesis C-methylase UbiE
LADRIRSRASLLARELLGRANEIRGTRPAVVVTQDSEKTRVDHYWNAHTVNSKPFPSAKESERYLQQRSTAYPLFAELMDLYGDHAGELVLDYGCGPGDDVTGFLLWSNARKVVGIDVSEKALGLLRRRLAMHRVNSERVQLIRITDSTGRVPLPDATVDWLHCGGVLHHTTHPHEIVKEFHRVMKPGAQGRLMLYNRDSIWYHVWIAYAQRIVNDAFPGLSVDEAFTRSTDGPDCPVSDAWSPEKVLQMISASGLTGRFRGGYFNAEELGWLKKYGDGARTDERLGVEHRQFASELEIGSRGYPTWRGQYVGIGGVYTISKPA